MVDSNRPAVSSDDSVGVVVIGRNEGERLKRCLHSLLSQDVGPVVYVDSGSTDDSVAFSESVGVEVVNLDTTAKFTMARGRNAGFQELLRCHPAVNWVQFVDGDCEVERGWIQRGVSFLKRTPEVVGVCGFRRERFPEDSIYNRLIDLEWRGPLGEIKACGGDAMYRVPALRACGGFNETMIAGEEPELCVRLRALGGKIWRLDCPMTLHDAALTEFNQWYKRATRAGHAQAEGFALHGLAEERHNARQLASSLTYGVLVPATSLALVGLGSVFSPWLSRLGWAVLAAAYAKVFAGAYGDRRRRGDSVEDARLFAAFCALGKVPEALGALTYFKNRITRTESTLIEYKRTASEESK